MRNEHIAGKYIAVRLFTWCATGFKRNAFWRNTIPYQKIADIHGPLLGNNVTVGFSTVRAANYVNGRALGNQHYRIEGLVCIFVSKCGAALKWY